MRASLVVGGVFLLAMIAASAWAAATLPAGARIAIHCGFPERCYLAPKRAGLVIWPAVGAVVFGVFGGIAASSLAADWVAGASEGAGEPGVAAASAASGEPDGGTGAGDPARSDL